MEGDGGMSPGSEGGGREGGQTGGEGYSPGGQVEAAGEGGGRTEGGRKGWETGSVLLQLMNEGGVDTLTPKPVVEPGPGAERNTCSNVNTCIGFSMKHEA